MSWAVFDFSMVKILTISLWCYILLADKLKFKVVNIFCHVHKEICQRSNFKHICHTSGKSPFKSKTNKNKLVVPENNNKRQKIKIILEKLSKI